MTEPAASGSTGHLRSSVLSLFPTLVWRAELDGDVRARIEQAVLAVLEARGAPLCELGPGRSFQSDADFHRAPELAELAKLLARMTGAIVEFLRVGHEGFDITGCWANVNAPGAAHAVHKHPNNFLSGVYYVRVADGSDTIQFHDPRVQAQVMRPPVRELTGENTDLVVVRVQPGTLLLFPSWFEHSVPPNRSDAVRVTLGFNVMFKRYAETMAPPMWEPGFR